MSGVTAPEHFRPRHGLALSSIGLGTYLGHWDEATDKMYQEAIARALEIGCNVIDSAINYRFQRSERCIGSAIKQLIDAGGLSRDEVVVATKGGFFPFDNEPPRDPRRWIAENLIDTGAARHEDMVDSHCMSPSYLRNQLARSLENLGLDTIDIYYVHNPETQLEGVDRDEFTRRMHAAFEFLERAAEEGQIQLYGTATWNGYRNPAGASDHLSISEMERIAREVAGQNHRFRVVQLPYNLAMPEALTVANQTVDGERLSMLEASTRLGITIMCSASIFQARLAQNLPPNIAEAMHGLSTDAQRAIQFVRSTPGVTTALVGMSTRSHVEENLTTAHLAPAPLEDFLKLFSED
jgi:aryl-alcohol dehydrogenase-like predicted oxidoreductase